MAQITPNLQLTVWNNLNDPYDSGQLADNFVKIDLHNHDGAGGGIQLNGSTAIAPDSISSVQIGANAIGGSELLSDASNDANRAVGSNHIKDSAVISNKIADQAITPSKLENGFLAAVRPLYIDGTLSQYTTINTAINAAYPGYQVVNGTEIYYKAATNVVWHLRYNSSASTYKWEFLGGSPMFSASTNATEYDNTGTDYKISTASVINLPYALTGGIFDITISAYVTVTNDTNMIRTGIDDYEELTTVLRDSLETSVAGAFISYQWTSNGGSAGNIDAAGGTNQFAGIADLLAYNRIGDSPSKDRDPAVTLSLTLRSTKTGSPSLSRSTIAFAQRRQDNAAASDTASFANRTIQLRPVAII